MLPFIIKHLTLRTFIIYAGISIGLLLFITYTLFQARFLIAGPQITFLNQQSIVQQDRTIILEGRVQNIIGITLNGRAIYTDENGYFKETLILENGYTIATLRAQDRYGRKTTQTQSFVYVSKKLPINL